MPGEEKDLPGLIRGGGSRAAAGASSCPGLGTQGAVDDLCKVEEVEEG